MSSGSQISQLTSASSISSTDYIPIVTDTSGTPLTQKITGEMFLTGWVKDSDTWVYVSSTSFKVVGKDVTSKFPKGTKIKLTQTTIKYFYVTATSFSTDTTVTIMGGTDYSLANATITDSYYSYAEIPQNYPFHAIHDNIAGEIATITEKITPVLTDLLIIEDSAVNNAKKRVQVGNLIVGINGWIPDSDTWVYVSSTSFKVVGKDVTNKFPIGTKIKLDQTGDKYFYVVSTAFSTDTTVTVTGGSDYTIANATISSPSYSYVATPQEFPNWFNWTPTYGGSGSMTYTSVTTDYALFKINENLIDLKFSIVGTTGGTASHSLTVSLPITRTSSSVQNLLTSIIPSGSSVYSVGQTFSVNTTSLNVRRLNTENWTLGASTRATVAGSVGITF